MRKFKIVAISNQYKDTLDDFIDSSDPESLDRARLIDKRSCNAPMSKSGLTNPSGEDCLDENFADKLSQLAPKTRDSQVR